MGNRSSALCPCRVRWLLAVQVGLHWGGESAGAHGRENTGHAAAHVREFQTGGILALRGHEFVRQGPDQFTPRS